MNCPVCNGVMAEKDFGSVTVDVCEDGCKCVWFDWMELSKLDEENEGCGQALTEAINHPRSNDEDRGQLKCPKCGIAMRPHKYKSSKQVNVDECYQCGGFFLDSGELNVIKDTFMSEQERDQYIQKMLSESPEYQQLEDDMERQIQIQKERTKAIRNMTKYITISYYMNRGK